MRIYLKIKICSLAEEAKIIRRHERRLKAKPRAPGELPPAAWWGLNSHRRFDVRTEQRAALLAYGFLRGRRYRQIEAKCHEPPDWKRVCQLVDKFGGMSDDKNKLAEWAKAE